MCVYSYRRPPRAQESDTHSAAHSITIHLGAAAHVYIYIPIIVRRSTKTYPSSLRVNTNIELGMSLGRLGNALLAALTLCSTQARAFERREHPNFRVGFATRVGELPAVVVVGGLFLVCLAKSKRFRV